MNSAMYRSHVWDLRILSALIIAVILHALVAFGVRFDMQPPPELMAQPVHVIRVQIANGITPAETAPEGPVDHRGGSKLADTERPPNDSYTTVTAPGFVQAPPAPTPSGPGAAAYVPPPSLPQGEEVATIAPIGQSPIAPPPQQVQPSSTAPRLPPQEQIGEPSELPATPRPPQDSRADEQTPEDPPISADHASPEKKLKASELMRQARQLVRNSTPPRQVHKGSDSSQAGADSRFSVREAYVEAWVRKIEAWGTRNFPDEARRQNLTGKLTLEVTLSWNGAVQHMFVVRSSKHPVLDEAAKSIVELAAPYAPFPNELRSQYGDTLTIRRTWQFLRGSELKSP